MKTHPMLWRNTLWLPSPSPWRMHALPTSGFRSSSLLYFPQDGEWMFVLLQFLDPMCSRTFSPKVGLFFYFLNPFQHPHRHLREALLVRSRRRLVRRLGAPEREKDGGTEAPRAAPSPEPGSAAGPSWRGGRTLVLRAAGGASSSVAERRRCLRAARRVCSLCASSAPAGATRSSAVGLLGCLCALLLPALSSPGFSGPQCYG